MAKINKVILNSITKSDNPIDFIQISDTLNAQKLSPNKTTIYRNLEKLEQDGLIKKVLLSDQKQYWEKVQTSSHYHFHLVCNLCKKIECREFAKPLDLGFTDFLIQKSEFNIFGLCQQCQTI
jgi:Fe2+ or Zn2+ uptake regulation protein